MIGSRFSVFKTAPMLLVSLFAVLLSMPAIAQPVVVEAPFDTPLTAPPTEETPPECLAVDNQADTNFLTIDGASEAFGSVFHSMLSQGTVRMVVVKPSELYNYTLFGYLHCDNTLNNEWIDIFFATEFQNIAFNLTINITDGRVFAYDYQTKEQFSNEDTLAAFNFMVNYLAPPSGAHELPELESAPAI